MDKILPRQQSFVDAAGARTKRVAQKRFERLRQAVRCDEAEMVAVIKHKGAERGREEGMRPVQYRVEHRREIAARGIDDLQDFGGRSLLLQRLARLGDQPRVLHRYHGLGGEVL